MFFLLSGEGVTDIGVGKGNTVICEGEDFLAGPMAIIVDQAAEPQIGFSFLDNGCCGYVSEARVTKRAGRLKAKKKARLPGKKKARETGYFFNTARILSIIAKEQEQKREEDVIAVLFRDSDGTASAGRGLWEDKRTSMLAGFEEEGFLKGVPMIPKPKSEVWLICAFKENAYHNCQDLQERSGNDGSPNSLKKELADILAEEITPEFLCEKVRNHLNIDNIKMTSFQAFRDRLEQVLTLILNDK